MKGVRSFLQNRRPAVLVVAILAPLLAFLTLFAWSLSSTVGSSPDDDFHLASIWCGLGERDGLCEIPREAVAEENPGYRLVPASIPDASCFAFLADESGDCWDADESGMAIAKRANADGLYPPLFYGVMSIFATKDVTGSVVTMRVVNSAFAVALITATFFLLPRRLRPALLVSVLATSVPLGLFLYASTNPSSWALLSAAVVWVSLYGAFLTDTRGRRIALTALGVFGALIGAGARADSAIYAVFGAGIAVLLGWRRGRSALLPTAGAVAILALSAILYLTSGQSGAAVTGIAAGAEPLTRAQQISNFLNIPLLWAGALGNWGLGWLDTLMPGGVWVLTLLVFGGALFIGLAGFTWRRAIAFVGCMAAIWIVPFLLLASSDAVIGAQVQPRYILPLMIIALGVAAASPAPQENWTGSRVAVMGTALTVAAVIALNFNIRRYTTGVDVAGLNPGSGAEWWWPVSPSPAAVWIGGSIAFATLLAVMWLMAAKPALFDSSRTTDIGSRRSPVR